MILQYEGKQYLHCQECSVGTFKMHFTMHAIWKPGQKPDDHMAGLSRGGMQCMLFAQVHTHVAVQVPNWHIVWTKGFHYHRAHTHFHGSLTHRASTLPWLPSLMEQSRQIMNNISECIVCVKGLYVIRSLLCIVAAIKCCSFYSLCTVKDKVTSCVRHIHRSIDLHLMPLYSLSFCCVHLTVTLHLRTVLVPPLYYQKDVMGGQEMSIASSALKR